MGDDRLVDHVIGDPGRRVPAAQTGAVAAATPGALLPPALDGLAPVPSTLDAFSTAPGLEHHVLIAWGDPVEAGAPAFSPTAQTAAAQAKQFGYNCDYTAIVRDGDGYLLWVNHEDDPCGFTLTSLVKDAAQRSGAPLVIVRGGGPARGDACMAYTHHGFVGVEKETVLAMRSWIKTGAVPAEVGTKN